MENLIWVLGASDPEMAAIETLLRECGQTVVYATIDGRRVTPAEAYRADAPYYVERIDVHGIQCEVSGDEPAGTRLVPYDGQLSLDWDSATVVRVECSWAGAGATGPICDHHNPGDQGYGRPPAEFLAASSIGQVVSTLARRGCLPPQWEQAAWLRASGSAGQMNYWGRPGRAGVQWCVSTGRGHVWIPSEIVLVAAADHCLAAAYRGECPGADPDAVMRWRAESRAKFQNRPVEVILADVHKAMEVLRAAPEVVLDATPGGHCGGEYGSCGCRSGGYGYGGGTGGGNGDCYCDCSGCCEGDHYVLARDMRGVHVYELPEASARLGVCFISDGLPGRDGRVKVVCQSGTPEQIEAFMRVFAPSIGLVDIYGDPARGFAGGYKSCAT